MSVFRFPFHHVNSFVQHIQISVFNSNLFCPLVDPDQRKGILQPRAILILEALGILEEEEIVGAEEGTGEGEEGAEGGIMEDPLVVGMIFILDPEAEEVMTTGGAVEDIGEF